MPDAIERRVASREFATPAVTARNPANGKTRMRRWLNQFDQGFVKYTIPKINTPRLLLY